MQRLDRLLATYGNISRKTARDLIRAGEVLVDGMPAQSPEQKIPGAAAVSLFGKPLYAERYVYYMMNKPTGVLSATRDPEQKTVLDLLPPEFARKGLFPAGRLDKDTEGFVLITDNGRLAHRILSPKSHVPKTYSVVLSAPVPPELPSLFEAGLDLGGGDVCSPAVLRNTADSVGHGVELVIHEGMYHQVKRMFATFSLEVLYLKRLAIGGLRLDESLPPGDMRRLSRKEIEQIAQGIGSFL